MGVGPRRFRRLRRVAVAGVVVPLARGPLVRLLGLALLDRDRAGPGLLIPRCRSIHTFAMRFPLEVVFLDGAGRELRRIAALAPGRVAFERRAAAVLELPAADQTSGKPIQCSPDGGSRSPAGAIRSSARVSRGSSASSHAASASAEPAARTSTAPTASASGPASR